MGEKLNKFTINTVDGTYQRIRSLDDGSCFFHSFLYAIVPEYRDYSISKKTLMVRDLRKELADNLSVDIFRSIGNGNISDTYTQIIMANTGYSKDISFHKAYIEYKNKLFDHREYVGEEVIDLLSKFFKIGVFFVSPKYTDYVYKIVIGDDYTDKNDHFIVLWYDNNHYDLVVRIDPTINKIMQTRFSSKSPLVKYFRKKLNN